jgi:hypothetical protein
MVVMAALAKRDVRVVPRFTALVIAVATIPSIIAHVTRSTELALAMLWIFIPLSYAPFGPTFALLQNLTPASMRAQSAAIMLLLANVANLVIAPQLIGFASDRLAPVYGADSLRIALIPLAFTGFWGAWHYLRCAAHLRQGLEHVVHPESLLLGEEGRRAAG